MSQKNIILSQKFLGQKEKVSEKYNYVPEKKNTEDDIQIYDIRRVYDISNLRI